VQTELLSATGTPAERQRAVARAVELLHEGAAIGLPTETVYGLAADATNPTAVAQIFSAKERPFFDPLIVHLPDRSWVERLTMPAPRNAELLTRLLDRFWPGPLTVLLPRQTSAVPDLVTAGSPLVALRQSAHPVFREVIETFGRPLAAPSANRFGRISPTRGEHVVAELGGRIPLVLDAGQTAHGLESTIIVLDASVGILILRHGPVTAEQLADFTPVQTTAGVVEERAAAPGQTTGHYAPRTPLRLLLDANDLQEFSAQKRLGWLGFRDDRRPENWARFALARSLSANGDLHEAAVNFFSALRQLDEAGLDCILAEPVPELGLGRAIMERLRRAAAGSGGTAAP